MLICGQFIAKDVNLWSTLLFERFEKLNFSDFRGLQNLLGPLKKTQLLDSWPLSIPLKNRPWVGLVWKKCPVSNKSKCHQDPVAPGTSLKRKFKVSGISKNNIHFFSTISCSWQGLSIIDVDRKAATFKF